MLRPEKALDLLQESFARIRHLQPGMKLLIVGSGPELPRLQINGQRLGIQNDCVFEPATSQVPQYLRALDIFVLCSRSEAFSNTLLEAMACGCCAVGSQVGGTPELIGNDERGLLFRPGDAGDLAEKLTTLIGNERLRREFPPSRHQVRPLPRSETFNLRSSPVARERTSTACKCSRTTSARWSPISCGLARTNPGRTPSWRLPGIK